MIHSFPQTGSASTRRCSPTPIHRLRRAATFCFILLPACGDGLAHAAQGPDQQDCKILFVGNSLTYFNEQPQIVEQLASAAGKSVYVDQAMMGGARLEDHAHSGQTLEKIREQEWDFVILQQAIMEVAFPDMHQDVAEPIEILKNTALSTHGDVEVIYFMDYSMKDGLYWFGQYFSYDASQQMLYDGTLLLADLLDLSVAPIGWAWNTVLRERPDLELYATDDAHPSYHGSYLGAAVYFATIFRESAVDNPYHGAVAGDVALYLQTVASEMVLDSLDLWRLPVPEVACGAR